VTKSKISLKHINYGAYVFVLMMSVWYSVLFYSTNKQQSIVNDIKIWLTFYLVSMVIFWITILAMQVQANQILRKVTEKNVGTTKSLIAKL